jgi:hypothetical protein
MAKNIEPTPQAKQDQDARDAEALLNNGLWLRALDEIEEAYTREWKRTEGPHAEYRERAYFMVRAVDKLRQHVNEFVSTGKLHSARAKETIQGK